MTGLNRKICNNCGKENPDDSVFCQYCGMRLHLEVTTNDAQTNMELLDYEIEAQNEDKQTVISRATSIFSKRIKADEWVYINNPKKWYTDISKYLLHKKMHHILAITTEENRICFVQNAITVIFRGREDLFIAVYKYYADYICAYNLVPNEDGKLNSKDAALLYEEIVADIYSNNCNFSLDNELRSEMIPFLSDMRGRILRFMELADLESYSAEKWAGKTCEKNSQFGIEGFKGSKPPFHGIMESTMSNNP